MKPVALVQLGYNVSKRGEFKRISMRGICLAVLLFEYRRLDYCGSYCI